MKKKENIKKAEDVAMTASVMTHYHFDSLHEQLGVGLIETYAQIGRMALEFETEHAKIEEWDVFLADKDSCDWEIYVADWVEKNHLI